jgi:hypothetical protein
MMSDPNWIPCFCACNSSGDVPVLSGYYCDFHLLQIASLFFIYGAVLADEAAKRGGLCYALHMWGRVGIAVVIIVMVAIWVAAVWIVLGYPLPPLPQWLKWATQFFKLGQ